jgi:SAM-dependent methyltransferase
MGSVRGNTTRFRNRCFPLWRCPSCASIHSLAPVDLDDIYRDYPLDGRELDAFARVTLGKLVHRLTGAGLRKDHRVLDYGCGSGTLAALLRSKGYEVCAYDPYVPRHSKPPEGLFDVVIANDVIEHSERPRDVIQKCAELVRPEGFVYVGTPGADDMADMANLSSDLMRLHQPFHRVILSEQALEALGSRVGLTVEERHRRSSMNTLVPFFNHRCLAELHRALDDEMDRAFEPGVWWTVLSSPRLWWYGLFGFFASHGCELGMVFRKPSRAAHQAPNAPAPRGNRG